MVALLLGLSPMASKPAVGGYQLFEDISLDNQAVISLAALGDSNYYAKIAPGCCIAQGLSSAEAKAYQAYIDAGVVVSLGVVGGQAVYRFAVNSAKVSAADRAALAALEQKGVGGVGNGGTKLTQSQIDDILSRPKSQRPDPSTYMLQAEIDAHLAKFDDGAVRFFTPHPSGTIGPESSFVFPKSYLNDLYASTGGNIRAIEQRLGLPSGYLDNAQAAVVARPNVRMPSGNEVGAHPDYWIPGGYTSGGVPEAVIPGQIKVNDVTVKTARGLFNGN